MVKTTNQLFRICSTAVYSWKKWDPNEVGDLLQRATFDRKIRSLTRGAALCDAFGTRVLKKFKHVYDCLDPPNNP
jgi:hypothetical protein